MQYRKLSNIGKDNETRTVTQTGTSISIFSHKPTLRIGVQETKHKNYIN